VTLYPGAYSGTIPPDVDSGIYANDDDDDDDEGQAANCCGSKLSISPSPLSLLYSPHEHSPNS
jgi:hypothetical protein